MLDLSPIEICVEFSKLGNIEYLQAIKEACMEMISSETLENLIQSIPYQIKSVKKGQGLLSLEIKFV
jgi:hypothetical protein